MDKVIGLKLDWESSLWCTTFKKKKNLTKFQRGLFQELDYFIITNTYISCIILILSSGQMEGENS